MSLRSSALATSGRGNLIISEDFASTTFIDFAETSFLPIRFYKDATWSAQMDLGHDILPLMGFPVPKGNNNASDKGMSAILTASVRMAQWPGSFANIVCQLFGSGRAKDEDGVV